MMANRADQIHGVLKQLVDSSSEIEGAAMVTVDGLPLASVLSAGADEDRVSAMAAAMLAMGERTVAELRRGTLEQVYVKGNGGYVVLMQAGPETVLETISSSAARLGLILLEMKDATRDLSKLV
jgi:predicted regulator of Ras-like GTPase activity (Roadblock/LC7/MglB family)